MSVCTSARLCASVCGWVLLGSFWLRCSHIKHKKQTAWLRCESSGLPRPLESTLYQLRWEHVTAVCSHRSLCKNQQLLTWLSSLSALQCKNDAFAQCGARSDFSDIIIHYPLWNKALWDGFNLDFKWEKQIISDKSISSHFPSWYWTVIIITFPPSPTSSPWFTRKRSFCITARFPDTL